MPPSPCTFFSRRFSVPWPFLLAGQHWLLYPSFCYHAFALPSGSHMRVAFTCLWWTTLGAPANCQALGRRTLAAVERFKATAFAAFPAVALQATWTRWTAARTDGSCDTPPHSRFLPTGGTGWFRRRRRTRRAGMRCCAAAFCLPMPASFLRATPRRAALRRFFLLLLRGRERAAAGTRRVGCTSFFSSGSFGSACARGDWRWRRLLTFCLARHLFPAWYCRLNWFLWCAAPFCPLFFHYFLLSKASLSTTSLDAGPGGRVCIKDGL